ncbi:MAG: hypothetical protein LBK00_02560 [Treponema sp.]|jgi:hypothetical protein|nr:hypothetical protein [Treponema sp.]
MKTMYDFSYTTLSPPAFPKISFGRARGLPRDVGLGGLVRHGSRYTGYGAYR